MPLTGLASLGPERPRRIKSCSAAFRPLARYARSPEGRNVRSSGRRLRGFGRHASRRPPRTAPGAQKHAKTSQKQPFPSKILGKNLFLARFWLHRARTTLTRGAPRAVSFCTAWRGPGGRRRCFPSRGAAHEKRAPSNVKGRAGTRRSTGTPNPRAR